MEATCKSKKKRMVTQPANEILERLEPSASLEQLVKTFSAPGMKSLHRGKSIAQKTQIEKYNYKGRSSAHLATTHRNSDNRVSFRTQGNKHRKMSIEPGG